jgi:hypothetical protein
MFENTFAALRECNEELSQSCDPLSLLSPSERRYALRLLKLCRDLADDYAIELEGRT